MPGRSVSKDLPRQGDPLIECPGVGSPLMVDPLRSFFCPRGVAVVGASRNPSKWGGRVVKYLQRYRFGGGIFPVNPSVDSIGDLPSYPSVASLPTEVDIAVIALPAEKTAESVEELGSKGIGFAVILGSGFAELGEPGKKLQRELVGAGRANDVRICGPNSVGMINVHHSFVAAATSALELDVLRPGGLSVISQSGAVGLGVVLTRSADRGVGLAKLVSTGNESDLSSDELLHFLIDDPETHAVALFLEGLEDGRKLRDAVRRATAAGKPVALLKAGKSEVAAHAVATHTGQIAGDERVFEEILVEAGASWCRDLEDLLDKTRLDVAGLSSRPLRTAVMSTSGGINTLAVDILAHDGIPVANLSPETRSKLEKLLPPFNPVRNPLDISGQVATQMGIQFQCLQALCDDRQVDAVIVILTVIPTYGELAELILTGLKTNKLVIFVNAGGDIAKKAIQRLQADGSFPCFESLSQCAAAIRDASRLTERLDRREKADVASSNGDGPILAPPLGGADLLSAVTLDGFVNDALLADLLRDRGIDHVPTLFASGPDEAAVQARSLGFPVVVKALGCDVPHRTEMRAVRLGLRDMDEVKRAYMEISTAIRRDGDSTRSVPIMVQKQLPPGIEVLIGGKLDDQFGPIITVAQGGILVGHLGSSAIRTAPLDADESRRLVEALPNVGLLKGFRGSTPADIDALAVTIQRASILIAEVASDSHIETFEFDLNPVIVLPRGEGASVVDWLLKIQFQGNREPAAGREKGRGPQ